MFTGNVRLFFCPKPFAVSFVLFCLFVCFVSNIQEKFPHVWFDFSYFTKSGNISESHEYSYVNDEIRYSTYVSYSIHDYDFKRSQHVHYNLTYAYGPVAQYIHFLSDYAIPVKLAELPDYCPSKRYLKVEAYAARIKLHESGEYYEAVLYDREGHSIKCQIDNIRTGDTYADIKNATTFVGGIWHEDCFEVSCYE